MRLVYAAIAAFTAAAACSSIALAQGYPLTGVQARSTTVMGEDVAYPVTGKPVLTSAVIIMAPGQSTHVHRHGAPLFVYVLEGEVTVDYGDRGKRVFKQGESLIEAMNVRHFGTNSGSGTLRLLTLYMGAEGTKDVLVD